MGMVGRRVVAWVIWGCKRSAYLTIDRYEKPRCESAGAFLLYESYLLEVLRMHIQQQTRPSHPMQIQSDSTMSRCTVRPSDLTSLFRQFRIQAIDMILYAYTVIA